MNVTYTWMLLILHVNKVKSYELLTTNQLYDLTISYHMYTVCTVLIKNNSIVGSNQYPGTLLLSSKQALSVMRQYVVANE